MFCSNKLKVSLRRQFFNLRYFHTLQNILCKFCTNLKKGHYGISEKNKLASGADWKLHHRMIERKLFVPWIFTKITRSKKEGIPLFRGTHWCLVERIICGRKISQPPRIIIQCILWSGIWVEPNMDCFLTSYATICNSWKNIDDHNFLLPLKKYNIHNNV